MIPSFKQQIASDVTSVFMNFQEFAEMHNIDGNIILCMIDNNELVDREKRYKFNRSLYAEGVYLKELLIYVRACDMEFKLPAIGRSMMFDGKLYIISDAIHEDGIFSLTLEANKT